MPYIFYKYLLFDVDDLPKINGIRFTYSTKRRYMATVLGVLHLVPWTLTVIIQDVTARAAIWLQASLVLASSAVVILIDDATARAAIWLQVSLEVVSSAVVNLFKTRRRERQNSYRLVLREWLAPWH